MLLACRSRAWRLLTFEGRRPLSSVAFDLCHLPVTAGGSASAQEAAGALNDVTHEYLSLKGDPIGAARRAIEADDQCVLAHCAVGLFNCIGQSKPFSAPEITTSLQRARIVLEGRKGAAEQDSPRDSAFVDALQHWSTGRIRDAVNSLENWIALAPRDILALRICQDAYLFLGDGVNCRDLIGRVLPFWQPGDFGYGYVMGMYAFGLCEAGDLHLAEQWADKALGANAEDIWALHAKAHVLEMSGRANEGQSLLRGAEEACEEANLLSNHMAWHTCVFYLDHGNERAARRIYEDRMRPTGVKDGPHRARKTSPFPLTDCSSLLWRMELNRMAVPNELWEELAEAWSSLDKLQLSTFNDLHTVMVYSKMAGMDTSEDSAPRNVWHEKAQELLDRLARQGNTSRTDMDISPKMPEPCISSNHPARWFFSSESDNAWVSRAIGAPLGRALLAYQLGEFEEACSLILPIRHHLHHMGGSNAQRDVFHLTLLEAALRMESETLGRVLAAERVSQHENSAQSWNRLAKVLERAGNISGSLEAAHTARVLGLGQGGHHAH